MKPVFAIIGFAALASAGCTHTVRFEPSDKPIQINLNVKIEQEVRVKLEREIDELISSNPDIF
jgi:hypothetical protein